MSKLLAAVEDAWNAGRAVLGQGRLATYIPELAHANPGHLGLAVSTIDGEHVAIGDATESFTLQSAAKPFALAYVLSQPDGERIFAKVGQEPSGDAFNSIVKLEEEHGIPRNPYINAGSLVLCEALPGGTAPERIERLLDFFAALGGNRLSVHEPTWRSEAATGWRNRALASFLRQYNTLDNIELALDTYFRQCAIEVDAVRLARLGLALATGGVEPDSGRRVVSPRHARLALALMATCGLYDEAGHFAVEVGLPAKSAVSGAILAVAPGRMSVCAWSPALNPRGNSVAALRALAVLSERLDLSVYSASARSN